MYFKISLLFCALYFITAVRSIGLSMGQINSCVQLAEKYNISNNEFNIIQSIEKPTTSVTDDEAMPELLINLANVEKESDYWAENGLTTYEVRLFVRMFTVQDQKADHDGLLTYAELKNLIDNGLNLERHVKDKIKNEFNNVKSINAQKFLAAILKYKPEGKGLDKTQIEKCFALYRSHLNHLITREQNELLQKLHIVSDEYKHLLEFEPVRSAAEELREFLVFWAEHNEDVDNNAPLLTSRQVREHIWQFSLYDKDKDGVLNFLEFNQLASTYFPGEDAELILKTKYDPDNGHSMSAAMFLYMQLTIRPENRTM